VLAGPLKAVLAGPLKAVLAGPLKAVTDVASGGWLDTGAVLLG
jgi:hypothetical protein